MSSNITDVIYSLLMLEKSYMELSMLSKIYIYMYLMPDPFYRYILYIYDLVGLSFIAF